MDDYPIIKGYHELMSANPENLDESELVRRRFFETIPVSVVAALSAIVAQKQKEVVNLEREIDEILDFLSGFTYLEATHNSKTGDTKYD